MEIRQLKYFLRVAETLNFSQAARELFITQSTLSQQILHLEQELSQQLFVRNSHEVILTEAGEMLLPMARDSVYMVDNCVQRIQELGQLLMGELNIGVTFSFSGIMAETMIDFMHKHPKVKLSVCFSSMEDLIERLQRHELDLVLAFKPNEGNPRIESQVLFNNCLAAVVNSQHPLAQQKGITLEDLQHHPLVLPTKGLQARNAFDRMTAHSGLQYNIKAEINNVGLLFKFVRQTKYVTVLSESTVIDETGLVAIPVIGSGSTVADGAEGFKNEMEGCIHTLKNGYQKASAREFIHLLHQSTAIWRVLVRQ